MTIRKLNWHQKLRFRFYLRLGRWTWFLRVPEGCICDSGGYGWNEAIPPICTQLTMKPPFPKHMEKAFAWLLPWDVCTTCGHDEGCHEKRHDFVKLGNRLQKAYDEEEKNG